jgi:hypothetical protein
MAMSSSERVQRALAAAAELTSEERDEVVAELLIARERDLRPEPGYDEAWASEIRRRVDAVLAGTSKTRAWPEVRSELQEHLERRRRQSA